MKLNKLHYFLKKNKNSNEHLILIELPYLQNFYNIELFRMQSTYALMKKLQPICYFLIIPSFNYCRYYSSVFRFAFAFASKLVILFLKAIRMGLSDASSGNRFLVQPGK